VKENPVAGKFKVVTLADSTKPLNWKEILSTAGAELIDLKAASEAELIPLLTDSDAILTGQPRSPKNHQ
jgi:hypothetical protein